MDILSLPTGIFLITCIVIVIVSTLFYRKAYNATSGHPGTRRRIRTATVKTKLNDLNNEYRYPFTPFPTGWFFVAESKHIQKGKVISLEALGKELVAYRGEDGIVRVVGAYCPHLGAHLGCGGLVTENCIRCPFHGWVFDGNGDVVEVPYSHTIPKGAKLDTWDVLEQNGLIFILNKSYKKSAEYPKIPIVNEITGSKWVFYQLMWRCRVHVQEVAENALDTGHFNIVHAYDTKPKIENFKTDGPIFSVYLTSLRYFLGMTATNHLYITYYGLGVVHATVESNYLHLKVILTTTPIDTENCEINIFAWYEKTNNFIRNQFLKWYLPYHIGYDFFCDIPIWENKIYQKQPYLCKGDGPIPTIRRWAKQFYDEGLEF